MSTFRERNGGVTGQAVVLLVMAVVALGLLAAFASDWAGFATLLWVVAFLPMFLTGLRELAWFWGTQLQVNSDGLFFGSDRPRTRPPSVSYAARAAYTVAWPAVSELRLVTGRTATRAMRRVAVTGRLPAQPTRFHGYFPAPFVTHHLALRVDLSRVQLPEVRVAARTSNPGKVVLANSEWVLPVRDVAGLRHALQAAGVAVIETTTPVGVAPIHRS